MGSANQANFRGETAGDVWERGRVRAVDLPLRCGFVAAQVATVLLLLSAGYWLGVVLPPTHRLYAPFFRGTERPGEWLEMGDPLWIARVRGFARRKIRWDELAEPAGVGRSSAGQ